LKGNNF